MMLTRCPYCGTTFRVTPEQLKIREGQVRCGKCRRVFDALRAMVEERPKLMPAVPPPVAPAPSPATHAELSWTFVQPAPPGADPDEHEPITITGFDFVPTRQPEPITISPAEVATGFSPVAEIEIEPRLEPEFGASEPDESPTEVAPSISPDAPTDDAAVEEPIEVITIEAPVEAEFEAELPLDEPESAEPAAAAESRREPEVPVDFDEPAEEIVIAPPPEPAVEPEQWAHFDPGPPTILDLHVEEPRKSMRWPWVVGSVLAVFLLISQLLVHYRSAVVAQQPETRPTFQAICEMLGCDVSLPKDVNLISIDSSDLSPNTAHPGVLHLTATLRNRASVAQSWPYLEITLTNAQERPLLRRALTPEEYLPPEVALAQGFPGRSEQVVQLSLMATNVPAVGYRLYIFYP